MTSQRPTSIQLVILPTRAKGCLTPLDFIFHLKKEKERDRKFSGHRAREEVGGGVREVGVLYEIRRNTECSS